MRSRQINFLRHPMSARQALAIALECWKEDRESPIALITPAGESLQVAKTIRVSFARERKKMEHQLRVSYGFTLSQPFPYTDAGVRGEAVIIRWRLTNTQNFRNLIRHATQELTI